MSGKNATMTADGRRNSALIKNPSAFWKGICLMVTFLIVLAVIFSPIFQGKNALRAADRLFNSIAKGSTNYMPGLIKKAQVFAGTTFTAGLKFANEGIAQQASKILTKAGAQVGGKGNALTVSGDLGALLTQVLKDSTAMFANQDEVLKGKYGIAGKETLSTWWTVLKEMERDLTRQKKFKEAAFVSTVVKKGVEVGYNFFGIQPQTASQKAVWLSLSLVFYVIYTLWWGIAILLIFHGVGLEMKAGAKKEV